MASPNTLARRELEPRRRTTLCGPHETVDNGKDKPSLAPILDKPFIARSGGEYFYDAQGCLRVNKKPSRRDLIRAVGGKAAYYRHLDDIHMLEAEQN